MERATCGGRKMTTDKTKTREGIPMSEEALADYNKVWTDMEEGIAYCYSHPCKLDKKKK